MYGGRAHPSPREPVAASPATMSTAVTAPSPPDAVTDDPARKPETEMDPAASEVAADSPETARIAVSVPEPVEAI